MTDYPDFQMLWYGDLLDHYDLPPTAKAPFEAEDVLYQLLGWFCYCRPPEPMEEVEPPR